MPDLTIGIPARNAAATIERAVRSALAQGDHPILLVDDWSDDDTVRIARALAGSRLSVVRPPEHRNLGFARQTGLLHTTTPYLVWLDADDELLPGRVERMWRCFRDGADIVSDGIELVDGGTGLTTKVAPIPLFLKGDYALTRQFERNYLPGSAMIGVRVEFARSVGYDGDLTAAEDSDFLLRSAFRKPRVNLLFETGYRMYTYPASLSRNIESQREMVRRTLLKHSYEDVRELYADTGYPESIARWALVSMALFRREPEQALVFLQTIAQTTTEPGIVLEPEGPSPYPEGWRIAFHTGTLELLLGRPQRAVENLELAERVRPSAEGANNLGVAYALVGHADRASVEFDLAIERYDGFLDPRLNREGRQPMRITTHLLRTHPARDDYVPSNAAQTA